MDTVLVDLHEIESLVYNASAMIILIISLFSVWILSTIESIKQKK